MIISWYELDELSQYNLVYEEVSVIEFDNATIYPLWLAEDVVAFVPLWDDLEA